MSENNKPDEDFFEDIRTKQEEKNQSAVAATKRSNDIDAAFGRHTENRPAIDTAGKQEKE